jgi:hypothetical protein
MNGTKKAMTMTEITNISTATIFFLFQEFLDNPQKSNIFNTSLPSFFYFSNQAQPAVKSESSGFL